MFIDNRLRSANTGLSILEALQLPTSALLGVDNGAATALSDVGIETIFDLSTSTLFAQAAMAATLTGSRVGAVPRDLFQEGLTEPADGDYSTLPIASLRALSNQAAAALSAALDVRTIQELASWPPRVAAHQMVGEAAGTQLSDVEDVAAERLRPQFGEYPTERVYFNRLVMLGMPDSPAATPLSDPLSLDVIVDNPVAFGKPAIGGLATYAQSWYAEGITLGHMLHSLTLAPGEATRVAVVDWSRRSRAASTEAIDENEQLNNSMDHSRSISEVQNAVAKEMQSGGSMSSGWAHSESGADNLSLSLGGGVAGIYEGVAGVFGFGGGGSTTSQTADTSFGAASTSWSVGSRSVMAEMSQRVNDRTEQHASAVRNRRASAVREVSQAEHEEISTRIVANYNHMHALTIQYYEVVQVYRALTALHSFKRVVFVPFALLDFTKTNADAVITRFQSALARAALNPRVRSLILDPEGSIEARSATRVGIPLNVAVTTSVGGMRTMAMTRDAATESASGAPVDGILTAPPIATVRRSLVRPGPIVAILPGDASLVSLSLEGVAVERVRIEQDGVPASDSTFAVPENTDQLDLATPIPVRRVTGLHLGTDGSAAAGTMFVRIDSGGRQSSFEVPVEVTQNTRLQRAAYFAGDSADRRKELLEHLQANCAYYTQAVLGNLDSASLVMLLSGVSWQGKPLVNQIEPNPIAVAGNYLVLGAPAEDDDPSGLNPSQTWAALLRDREITLDRHDQRIIPIPTGGVFAEAVLGRSNSAEKLDITRFWNWQDSPIPILPPEISPVTAGSRAQQEILTPGQLGAPLVNMVSPASVPDPAGLSAVLGAIASGNMFRDQSGLAGTQAAAQAASAGTLTAATEAGRIASENFKAATQQATEMGKAAADLWKAWKTSENSKSGSGGPGSGGISGDGARINQGRDLDRRGVSDGGDSQSSGSGAGSMSGPSLMDTLQEKWPGLTGNRSRELAYSDEAAAASPTLLQETTSALGVPLTPASSVGQPGAGAASIEPFPPAFANPLSANDAKLQAAFNSAIGDVKANHAYNALPNIDSIPIIMVALNAGTARPVVGTASAFSDMFYSGSMMKIAAMYAAHQLWEAVDDLAASMDPAVVTDEAKFFSGVRAAFDAKILAASTIIKAPTTTTVGKRAPIYEVIFTPIREPGTGKWSVVFRADGDPKLDFAGHMTKMIVDSHNPSAGLVIQMLGFSVINGALEKAGFFAPGTKKGIWLAGDYLGTAATILAAHNSASGDAELKEEFDLHISGWKEVRVPSANDGASKQATTCIDMVKLLVLMLDNKLLKSDVKNGSMLGLLHRAVSGGAQSIMKRVPASSFDVIQSKIGFGQLGTTGDCNPDSAGHTHGCIWSETLHVKQTVAPFREFAVVYQNLKDPANNNLADVERVRDVIAKTMEDYHP